MDESIIVRLMIPAAWHMFDESRQCFIPKLPIGHLASLDDNDDIKYVGVKDEIIIIDKNKYGCNFESSCFMTLMDYVKSTYKTNVIIINT